MISLPSRETCPECGRAIAVEARDVDRGRARCPTCALDVRVEVRDHGDGPVRSAKHLALIAPPAPPSDRLRVVRDASRLAIERIEDERLHLGVAIAAGVGGVALGVGLAVVIAVRGGGAWLLGGRSRSSRSRSRRSSRRAGPAPR